MKLRENTVSSFQGKLLQCQIGMAHFLFCPTNKEHVTLVMDPAQSLIATTQKEHDILEERP